MARFRWLSMIVIVLCVAASGCSNEDNVPSSHSTVDAYTLKVSPPQPTGGQRITLAYPEGQNQGYVGGFVFDLEKEKDPNQWERVARLAASTSGGEPSVLPA